METAGQNRKKIVLGVLAHVDAGKTTLAESLLYTCGNIRKLGRVDHQDAFLDNFALERERGITIFSKQAKVCFGDLEITLLDTPGHVDFSAEMERVLQVLDYAVLVVNGADGVQGHTRTLWRLLARYEIPVFLFVNKMDQPGTDAERLLGELRKNLSDNCVVFPKGRYSLEHEPQEAAGVRKSALEGKASEVRKSAFEGKASGDIQEWSAEAGRIAWSKEEWAEFYEELATCDEQVMNDYLETGEIAEEAIAELIADRSVFPCYFGSALKVEGVEELLAGLERYTLEMEYPAEFGARVYKISRDASGARLTHLKVTGGALRVKMLLDNEASAGNGEEAWQEKADNLRIYNGAGYENAEEVPAGGICAVTGLTRTFAGQGLGCEEENALPVLEPVLTYRLELPEGCDAARMLGQLRQLEEEEPLLHVLWQEENREIHVQVMGEVQMEIMKNLILERFGAQVEFGTGSIVYKETIAAPSVGIGHFEPLRHYAEVHLLLEPGEAGSGLQFASLCSEDMLDKNWQRLILTHLEEKTHVGVLTGAPITDLRILLTAGRAHLKHTEGGDFRQATYRAVRQGLRRAECVLLEPVFAFTLEVPTQQLGRAMSDIQRMSGSFEPPVTDGEMSVLTGSAPVASMRDYQREVSAYTHGLGHLSCVLKGYEPCHNAEEVIAAAAYDPESDLTNPTGSVFCAHGAGFVVNWDEVENYAHVEDPVDLESLLAEATASAGRGQNSAGWADGVAGVKQGLAGIGGGKAEDTGGVQQGQKNGTGGSLRQEQRQTGTHVERYISQEEIAAIFQQTYGNKAPDQKRRRRYHISHRDVYESKKRARRDENIGATETTNAVDDKNTTAENRRNKTVSGQAQKDSYLLVDGYNIIFAWTELRELAAVNIDSARDKLMDIMCNFQGMLGSTLILVFDAYRVKGGRGDVQKYNNIYVVYTKEAETADQYIEKTVHEIGKKRDVTVATSDALEQMIIWGDGAKRMSALGLKEAVDNANKFIREEYTERVKWD